MSNINIYELFKRMLQLCIWTVCRKKGYGESSKIIFSVCLDSKFLNGHNVSSPLVKDVQDEMQRYLDMPYRV